MSKKILLNDLFDTFQGEFPYQGRNATFVRFALCNLSCEWCDTMSGKQKIEEKEYKISDIVNKVKKTNFITFTGGEPTLYLNEMKDITNELISNGTYLSKITIETNGTKLEVMDDYYDYLITLGLYNINNFVTTIWSPKFYNDKLKNIMLTKLYEVYNNLNTVIKIVMDDNEINFIDMFINKAIELYGAKVKKNISLQLKTVNHNNKIETPTLYNDKNIINALTLAEKYNINISTRMHLDINIK